MAQLMSAIPISSLFVSIILVVLPIAAYVLLQKRLLPFSYVPASPHDTPQSSPDPGSQYEVSKALDAPDGWFTDPKTFALERRAIFSQTWLCITHLSHFRKPGDYLTFNIADFPFFLVLGKDEVLRGFHNVCRHRAYTVTRKLHGSSLVLGCKYHGWSYDTKGSLTKAPQFDNLPGFKKEDNGLYQIWVRTDPNGFVFVNFDADWNVFDPPTKDLNTFAKYSKATKGSSYLAFWQAETNFNWKQANALIEQPNVQTKPAGSDRLLKTLKGIATGIPQDERVYCPSSVSALTSIAGLPLWHMTVVEPISATRTSIRRTLYATKPNVQIPELEKLTSRMESDFRQSIKKLEDQFRVIKSAEEAVILSPSQHQLRTQIQNHVQLERKAGREITPARPLTISSEVNSSNCGVAERLCRELDGLAEAGAGCFKPGASSQGLAW